MMNRSFHTCSVVARWCLVASALGVAISLVQATKDASEGTTRASVRRRASSHHTNGQFPPNHPFPHQFTKDIAIPMTNPSKIINGDLAAFGEFPSFSYPDSQACGATLIYEDVIATAAHCSDGFREGDDMYIGGTKQDGSNAPETIAIDFALVHPEYGRDFNGGGDIMLLFLKSPSVAPVSPWNKDPTVPKERQLVTVVGHGATETGRAAPDLLKADLFVVNTTKCSQVSTGGEGDSDEVQKFGEQFVCTSARPLSACYGDSGGPLFAQSGLLVGLVSGGSFDCVRPDRPNRYTRLSTFSDWIQRNICYYSANPPTDGTCDDYTSPCDEAHTTECTFLGLLPGVTMHKNVRQSGGGDDIFGFMDDFFNSECTESCYPTGPQRMMRRGYQCGPCFDFDDDFFPGGPGNATIIPGTDDFPGGGGTGPPRPLDDDFPGGSETVVPRPLDDDVSQGNATTVDDFIGGPLEDDFNPPPPMLDDDFMGRPMGRQPMDTDDN